MTNYIVKKRTFAAKGKTGDVRDRLNADAVTSEYMPSYKYVIVCQNAYFTTKTKKEAVEKAKQLQSSR